MVVATGVVGVETNGVVTVVVVVADVVVVEGVVVTVDAAQIPLTLLNPLEQTQVFPSKTSF